MTRLLLDTNVLMKLCHPKEYQDVKEWLQGWLGLVAAGRDIEITVSAAAEYELRRGYLWKLDKDPNEGKALARLDAICGRLGVCPVSNDHLRAAAQHWADARRGGYGTAPQRDVDWDVIIASQAGEIGALVVTENTNHLSRYGVDAKDWPDIRAGTE